MLTNKLNKRAMRQKIERLTTLLSEAEKLNDELFNDLRLAYSPNCWEKYAADPSNEIDVAGIRPAVCQFRLFSVFHRQHALQAVAGFDVPRQVLLNLDPADIAAQVDARRVTSETKSPRQIERAERESTTAAQADSPAEAVA